MRPLQSYAGNEDPYEAKQTETMAEVAKCAFGRGQLENIFNTTINSLNLIRKAH